MAITKLQLADHLHKKMGLPKKDCLDFVNSFFNEISNSLENGEEVKLSGFGNFSLLKKKARPGRNPKTGKEHTISARTSVSFKPGRKLRDKID
jgi:integration host factor subunit alpha